MPTPGLRHPPLLGVQAHHGVRLAEGDAAGVERIAQYMFRCPFSLQRMIRVTDGGQVLYVAEKRAPQRFPKPASADLFGGVARNFQVFDPLDFIAELTQHIPDARKHLTRYFGFHSNKSRGRRAKANPQQGNDVEIERDGKTQGVIVFANGEIEDDEDDEEDGDDED